MPPLRAPRSRPAREADPTAAAWARAARVLEVRSRRESSGPFIGGYRSAFRGGGVEFEESRPYVPGDDVRSIDWNVLARTGTPFVKRFREERDQTLLLVVDVSGSMRFGTAGRAKAALAAHAGALLAAAAARAGDRVGLFTFDETLRQEIAPARGQAHAWSVLRALVEAPGRAGGGTGLARALAGVRERLRRRCVVVLLSDFRDDTFFAPPGDREGASGGSRAELVALARVHDVVAGLVHDPHEETLPSVGAVRIVDPERPGRTRVLRTRSRRARERYRAAALVRHRALVRRLRADGAEVLTLRTDRDPLRAWLHFFARRAAAPRVARGRA
jgi:uncharacterized protein (DUF58 family)